MELKTAVFIRDFKKSPIYKAILADQQLEVVMIWLTGSTLTGVCDVDSDYDLCVLCTQKPNVIDTFPTFRVYNRPTAYFSIYKPEKKKVQWIYNDLKDIIAISNITPLDNIGWAQFKYVPETFIFYKNPKYKEFIDYLMQTKDLIFKGSAYLFVKSILQYFNIKNLSEVLHCCQTIPNKALYHIGWLAESLQNIPITTEKLLKIKRTPVAQLSTSEINYLENCIAYLNQYSSQFDLNILESIDLTVTLQKFMKEE